MRTLLLGLALLWSSPAWAVYSATVTVTTSKAQGVRAWTVTIVETDAAAASEWSVVGLPAVGTITHYQSTLVSGTGTTIAPTLGKTTGWTASTQNEISIQGTAAAHFNDQTRARYNLGTTSTIFGISTVDAGTDNVVHTTFTVVEGHNS